MSPPPTHEERRVVYDNGRRKRRAPPPLTPEYLRDQARRHMQRFWPSVMQMRRVLMRRVDRCLEFHGGEREQGAAMVEAVISELLADGILDDARFARAWVQDLHRRGTARRTIAARLRTKGIDRALVQQALDELEEKVQDGELVRACAYARRRRLGSARPEHRRPTDREERYKRREKDIAALCRAGFGFGVARQVVDAEDLDLLLEQADGDGNTIW